ncbi:prepilin-type N-terminal cleavage/methylation domain-containing protein [Meiothermus rufus]|uniref:prepilin-type N-terminal cleavage/methylation domain-containing protein n=1 Tax=Meiothermus rufus TaxID=604332 RepID=UPI00040F3B98|nr:prepilin-type N-terminal cleavage/methylation domain-containing protein [Meiothermus rufus]
MAGRPLGFTLLEVALALLLLGVLAGVVASLGLGLQSADAQTTPAALEALVESGVSISPCPTYASVILGGRTYQVCQEVQTVAAPPITRQIRTLRTPEGHALTWVEVF